MRGPIFSSWNIFPVAVSRNFAISSGVSATRTIASVFSGSSLGATGRSARTGEAASSPSGRSNHNARNNQVDLITGTLKERLDSGAAVAMERPARDARKYLDFGWDVSIYKVISHALFPPGWGVLIH